MLSIVIPSYKDPLLLNTIRDILEHSVTDIEIIPVIDGYDCRIDFGFDKRIHPVFLKERQGMRNTINTGVMVSEGEYLMRTDEHCSFAPGFDEVILKSIEDNWIVTPVRYKLDVEKWEREDEPIYYEKLVIGISKGYGKKFSSCRWWERDIERKLKSNQRITTIMMVFHETSTSVINPVKEVGELAHSYGKTYIVDGVSAVGGEDVDVVRDHIDFCTCSSNKCLASFAGVGIICAKIAKLEKTQTNKPF